MNGLSLPYIIHAIETRLKKRQGLTSAHVGYGIKIFDCFGFSGYSGNLCRYRSKNPGIIASNLVQTILSVVRIIPEGQRANHSEYQNKGVTMKRLLLFGTLMFLSSLSLGCVCLSHGFSIGTCSPCQATPVTSCGYDSCGGGGCTGCGMCNTGCGTGCGAFSGFHDPYAGMYYASCDSACGGLKSIVFAPIHGLCWLLGRGGGCGGCGGYGCGGCGESRGGCGELYIGDYINNPPGCEPCDGYGNMRGYQAGCPTGNYGGCSSCSGGGGVMPMSNYQIPYAAPQGIPSAGCQNCGGGSTTYYSNNLNNVPATTLPATQRLQQQYVMQDNKLIGGPQQQVYQQTPIRQASGTQRIYR